MHELAELFKPIKKKNKSGMFVINTSENTTYQGFECFQVVDPISRQVQVSQLWKAG